MGTPDDSRYQRLYLGTLAYDADHRWRIQGCSEPIYGVLSFIILIMLITVLFCRIRSTSESVIPVILLHATHNLVNQRYMQPLPTDPRVPYSSPPAFPESS